MSGVYIPGMEMPNVCKECPMVSICPSPRAASGLYLCICRLDYSEHDFNTREHCPLVPVPDHGRLFDEEQPIKNIEEVIENLVSDFPLLDFNSRYCMERGLRMAKILVKAAPTIIPADKEVDNG